MNSNTSSTFLPEDFKDRPIGLIAGKGDYPIITATRLKALGHRVHLISFEGETDPDFVESFPQKERASIKVGQLGKLLKSLQKLDCGYALMAGQVTPKRLFHGLHPDLKALAMLNSLKVKNAETIFGKIADEIEALGIKMLDARVGLEDQLATTGQMTSINNAVDPDYLEHGIKIAKGITELDIGQGCVVRKGTVLAVEAYEGTDPMLKRAGSFKTDGLIFVKTVKKEQDFRFDVPVFGKRTLEVMHEVGIQTAALQTNGVIILNKSEILEEAQKKGISLFGFE